MHTRLKIFSIAYLLITSITVLVMLVASFEQFNEKYLPSFMLAQKFALPIVISAMAVAFLTFFEPEWLELRKTLVGMRIILTLTLVLFSFFLKTVNLKITSETTIIIYLLQWVATLATTFQFFRMKSNKGAQI
ncbi:MAG: hypothetical protein HYV29_14350 [Ignavibacteriales bacterium]|nr:hypothetical protein [Ignavibacteriales bacterium]